MSDRDPTTLRSHRWFGPDDMRSFGHRSRLKGMGFDDIDLAEQFIPPITSIRQDRLVIGETAAEMLMARILAPDDEHSTQAAVLPVSLVVRKSTAPPR